MSFDLNTYLITRNLPGGPLFTTKPIVDLDELPVTEANVRDDEGKLQWPAVLINLGFVAAIACWILFF